MKITPPFEFHLRELITIARHSAMHDLDIEPRVQAFIKDHGRLPSQLNGYPVIAVVPRMLRGPLAAKSLEYDRYVVLVKREHPDAPYVTALWSPSCGDSWDCGTYLGTLADGMQSLLERAQLVKEPAHDKGSAPPDGFDRYQIEIDVPDYVDSSELLAQAQQLAVDLIDEEGDSPGPNGVQTIEDRVSIQRMEG